MAKYTRNSGKKDSPKQENKQLSKKELSEYQAQLLVGDKLAEDARWMEELAQTNKFSFEWVHKVLEELLFQCMGKKEIVQGFSGQEKLMLVFKEKPAIEIISMIAKMNGHLFDVVKGTIQKKVEGSIEHKHEHKLIPDAKRTIGVFEILEECGALKPPTKQLSSSEVEQVHTA